MGLLSSYPVLSDRAVDRQEVVLDSDRPKVCHTHAHNAKIHMKQLRSLKSLQLRQLLRFLFSMNQ